MPNLISFILHSRMEPMENKLLMVPPLQFEIFKNYTRTILSLSKKPFSPFSLNLFLSLKIKPRVGFCFEGRRRLPLAALPPPSPGSSSLPPPFSLSLSSLHLRFPLSLFPLCSSIFCSPPPSFFLFSCNQNDRLRYGW